MSPELIIYILRLILCTGGVLDWLEKEAKKTDTPIDEFAVQIIKFLLCGERKGG